MPKTARLYAVAPENSYNRHYQVITSVPYSQVTTAQVLVTDDEEPDYSSATSGVIIVLICVIAFLFGLTLDSSSLQIGVMLFAFGFVFIGIHAIQQAYDVEKGRVRLKLTGVDGDTVFSATLPKSQTDFAQTVSRLIGETHRES